MERLIQIYGEADQNVRVKLLGVILYMERDASQENFSKDISLDDVSRSLQLTPYYFSKLFKQETGTTLMEYLTGLRIERAEQLLKDPDLSI